MAQSVRMILATVIILGPSVGSVLAQTSPGDDPSLEHEAYRQAWASAVDAVTPDGYLYTEARRCVGCHEAARDEHGSTTHRNAVGLTGDPKEARLTGKGWLSGGHGRSQDSAIVSNTHCAWCHAPSQPGVTARIAEAEAISSDRVGVSCIACHASDAANAKHGHYQANFFAGGDRDSLTDFEPRDPESGVETNDLCLYCHLRPHEFTAAPHSELLETGALRCIDCHMAVYNRLENGIEERYHNMKVAANNDPATCRPCHEFPADRLVEACAELVPPQESVVHAVPSFERQHLSPIPGFSWVVPDELAAMPVPGRSRSLIEDADSLRSEGITVLVSLTETAPDPKVLAAAKLKPEHIPVVDFTPPTPEQIDEFVALVQGSVERGEAVGVHCTAGLGRSGTMAAAYLVAKGQTADEAIETIRRLRPGSVETEPQEAAVRAYEDHISGTRGR